ncbi:hypothetical protein CCR75_001910 [Bremia lactucae]|uniref:Protein phosphatase 1 regulatory subunit 7 n=1 Tax=Bremia lactucae TaxID=4779 RepID=A0A976ICL6_BRELC|nr:hypothetical protein CCR75_001910 [Bremia lactucae]
MVFDNGSIAIIAANTNSEMTFPDENTRVKHVNTDALQAAMDERAQYQVAKAESDEELKDEHEAIKLSSCVDFSDVQEDELYYIGTSGIKVTDLDGLENLPNLLKLHVRSNLLRSMGSVALLRQLQHLELYDNQIQTLEGVQSLVTLKVLDLSFNEIRIIPDLSHLTILEELYVANNKLKKITGLENLKRLKKLDLGANRLRVMENLDGLIDLQELWLGKNKITIIQGLETLTELKIISVQSNRVVQMTGFAQNSALEELYLSHNGIEKIENIEHLFNLKTMDLGGNRIANIPIIMAPLTELEDLWLNNNQIAEFTDIEHLRPLKGLRTLYLEHNPVAQDFEYRKKIEELLPVLDQIDATQTTKARRRLIN